MRHFILLLAIMISAFAASPADAEFAFEKASAVLQSATVTVRVIPAAAPAEGDAADAEAPVRRVEVCSGASLGKGLVVTYADISTVDEVRITIPGGDQAKANLRVLDHVSGLTLLEIDNQKLAGFKSAEKLPAVGGWVLAGAGWGAEKPVVSFGILSGTNRTLRGGTFPPLLQCDLRTTDTSNGAPLVSQAGELVGIVVATDAPGSVNRLTYAVPVEHVRRLVRARHPNRVIRLDSRRPVVGLKLVPGQQPHTVFVGRVEEDGPADKAGVRVGDQVLAADGVKIRSVYEVLRPLLAKQPGAKINFTLQQGDKQRELDVVLGGGTVVQPAPLYAKAGLAENKVVIRQLGFAPDRIVVGESSPNTTQEEIEHKLEMQERAITGYLHALGALQGKIKQQDATIANQNAQIQKLQAELRAAKAGMK